MNRTDIINHLIKTYNYKSYLEIGVARGDNFEAIKCEHKVGVDPGNEYPKITHNITSNEYFKGFLEKFDIIFIDGYHEHFQFMKDVENSLKRLNKGGIIVCHDILPDNESSGSYPSVGSGTCWKGWANFRMNDSATDTHKMVMRVVDTDCGCGIIQAYENNNFIKELSEKKEIEWNIMSDKMSRNQLMNVISVEEFLQLYV